MTNHRRTYPTRLLPFELRISIQPLPKGKRIKVTTKKVIVRISVEIKIEAILREHFEFRWQTMAKSAWSPTALLFKDSPGAMDNCGTFNFFPRKVATSK